MTQEHKHVQQTRRLWIRFLLDKIIYFKFSFLRSGDEAKRGVEFRHSTRNTSKIQQNILNLGSFCLPCYTRYKAEKKIILFYYKKHFKYRHRRKWKLISKTHEILRIRRQVTNIVRDIFRHTRSVRVENTASTPDTLLPLIKFKCARIRCGISICNEILDEICKLTFVLSNARFNLTCKLEWN